MIGFILVAVVGIIILIAVNKKKDPINEVAKNVFPNGKQTIEDLVQVMDLKFRGFTEEQYTVLATRGYARYWIARNNGKNPSTDEIHADLQVHFGGYEFYVEEGYIRPLQYIYQEMLNYNQIKPNYPFLSFHLNYSEIMMKEMAKLNNR